MATGADATKTPARPSHESSTHDKATGVAETSEERIDHEAMEMAKRAENRLKDDDKDQIPGDSIFTK
jgi:hypothetical protein